MIGSKKMLALLGGLAVLSQAVPQTMFAEDSVKSIIAESMIPVTVTAVEQASGDEVPIADATVTLYVGSEARQTAITDAEGKAMISTEGLSSDELCKATISAYKTISEEKATDGDARDGLFSNFPKNEDGDYIRTEYQLHSELIDSNGNWVGESVSPRFNQADIIFVIDSTGSMGDVINNVKENVQKFSENLISQGLDIRFGIVDYRDIEREDEETVLHYLDGSQWFTDAVSVKQVLSNIEADGGGDEPESALDALGLVADDDIYWRSGAQKFAFLLTDASFKTSNSYGYESLDEVVDALKAKDIVTSVVTSSSKASAYSSLKNTGGEIFKNINSDEFYTDLKALSDSIINYTVDEKKLVLKEPRLLYNVSVSYLADDKNSRSDEYQDSVKGMLNEYAKDVAQTTDGHVLINKVILHPTDSRMNFFDTSNPAAMSDIQIQAHKDDALVGDVQVISNTNSGGFYKSDAVGSDSSLEQFNHFKFLESLDKYKSRQVFRRIQMSGEWDFSLIDNAASYAETLMHESGHYLFSFRDEYRDYQNKIWGVNVPKPIQGNYGVMDDQHTGIELSKTAGEYSYFGETFPSSDDTRHTSQSAMWGLSTEDMLAQEMTDGFSVVTNDWITTDVFDNPYKAEYTKASNGIDRHASYSYAGLEEDDYIYVSAYIEGISGGSGESSLKMATATRTVPNDFFDEIQATCYSLAPLKTKATDDHVTVSISAEEGSDYSLYLKKMGESEYAEYEFTESEETENQIDVDVPIVPSDLAEIRLVSEVDGTEFCKVYYIDRSETTDSGYIYNSVTGSVSAYAETDDNTTYTILADNTSYTNGSFTSVNEATRISSDNGKGITGGEIYAVASKRANINFSTLSWFKYADDTWTKLDTDISQEENMNIGTRADLDGEGLYVLMAESAVDSSAQAVQNLQYTQVTDRDAVVELSFDDPNEGTMSYNVYYSDSDFDSVTDSGVAVKTYNAGSVPLTLDLLEKGRQVYAAVEAVMEDGSKSPLSEIILIGGEADSDGDGIPDWYCDEHSLWSEDGEEKNIAESDDDGDGLSNLEEYLNGSDPKNPNDPVNTDNIALKSITLPEEFTVGVGQTADLVAVLSPENATNQEIVWSIDNGKIASAVGSNASCKITGISTGTAVVTAVSKDGGFITKCVVTVSNEIPSSSSSSSTPSNNSNTSSSNNSNNSSSGNSNNSYSSGNSNNSYSSGSSNNSSSSDSDKSSSYSTTSAPKTGDKGIGSLLTVLAVSLSTGLISKKLKRKKK